MFVYSSNSLVLFTNNVFPQRLILEIPQPTVNDSIPDFLILAFQPWGLGWLFNHDEYILGKTHVMWRVSVFAILLPLAFGGQFPFSATLAKDSSGQPIYELQWSFDVVQQTITFNVLVNTTGWVGFGLSRDGGMIGSDVVTGWVNSTGVYLQVRMHIVIPNLIARMMHSCYLTPPGSLCGCTSSPAHR